MTEIDTTEKEKDSSKSEDKKSEKEKEKGEKLDYDSPEFGSVKENADVKEKRAQHPEFSSGEKSDDEESGEVDA